MKKSDFLKVSVTCPVGDVADIQKAVGDAGAGRQGNYSHCSFVTTSCTGYFTPQEGANPAIGKIGEAMVIDEVKLEFTCERDKIDLVIAAMLAAHPYEAVGYDILERLDID
ncbi:hypothetical protein OAN96_01335 [Candidatus Gracilibacteria bacterium]|nr:hypothetical protein [Candidatus Gracilibacteria bacterium]